MNTLHSRVQRALDASGAIVKIHDHSAFEIEIKSPADFSEVVGLPLSRVTKSLFLRRKEGEYLVAVLGMTERVDFKKLAELVESKHVEVATADELQTMLDYPRNGVSPIGVPQTVKVVMEATLLGFSTIAVGGGSTGIEIEIAPDDVLSIASATVGTFASS